MEAAGVTPDLSSFNRIITAWGQVTRPKPDLHPDPPRMVQAKKPARAEAVLDRMKTYGEPNQVDATQSPAPRPKLEPSVSLPPNPDPKPHPDSLGVVPNTFCYNSLIDSWRDAKSPEDAQAVLSKMSEAGMAIDGSSYNRVT